MAALKIHAGLNGGESASSVPPEAWPELVSARAGICNSGLRANCRSLVFFVNDAAKNGWLGFGSFDDYIKKGLDLDPEIVAWALDGLKKLDGEYAVTLDTAVRLGRAERIAESKRLVQEEGKSLREAAREIGCDHTTVMKDLKVVEKTAYAEKSTTKRTENRLSIFSGTPPTTAAQKIREKFGEQFAKELKEAL